MSDHPRLAALPHLSRGPGAGTGTRAPVPGWGCGPSRALRDTPHTSTCIAWVQTSCTRGARAEARLRHTTEAAWEKSARGIARAQGQDRGRTVRWSPALSRHTIGSPDRRTFALVQESGEVYDAPRSVCV